MQTFVPSSIINDTDVRKGVGVQGKNGSTDLLERLSDELDELTPEARKAATYVLENPQEVGVSTVREIAKAAGVNPNTFVRMARQVGFEGYDDFRDPFRDAIRAGTGTDFPRDAAPRGRYAAATQAADRLNERSRYNPGMREGGWFGACNKAWDARGP